VWSHLVVAEGVELHVESGISGLSPEELREFYRSVMAQFESIRARHNKDQAKGNGDE
jgi:hypothetical protein